MLLKYVFILIFVARGITFSQSSPQKFIDALIYDKPEIMEYVNKDELKRSQRLGIEYNGVKNKFLIGGDIPAELKEDIKSGNYKYKVTEKPLADSYTEVTFKVPDVSYSKVFYFQNGFVTTSAYRSHKWEKAESKYFSYRLQESKYFNDYCKRRLDEFVDMVADTLGFTISEKRLLEKEKITYTFCANENEVEQITGFKAKGIAMLGSDEIVTSYQTHFHEVAHLLINYKLKKLGLYTLPFFMEGFAVAVGGRGGMAPRVVTDVGFYLQKTGFLTYDSILTFDQFYSTDANMSYAVSGLYNSFLLNELGGEKYLELYRNMSGSIEFVKNVKSDNMSFPEKLMFENYLQKYVNDSLLYFDSTDNKEPGTYTQGVFGYFETAGSYYKFFIADNFSIGPPESDVSSKYNSKLYIMLTGDSNHNPLKYYFDVDSSSVKIYNLLNDEMIYLYTKSLSIDSSSIPVIRGYGTNYYTFFVKKDYLNNDFSEGYIIK